MKDRFPFRVKEAGREQRLWASGFTDPEEKQRFVEDLFENEYVVFSPTLEGYETFKQILDNDPQLREYIERDEDPVLIAEILVRRYYQIFLNIDHVFKAWADWKRRGKRRVQGHVAGWREELRIPDHILEALTASELEMVARRWLRKHMKALNRDPKAAIADVKSKIAAEEHPKQRQLLRHVHALMRGLEAERYPQFVKRLPNADRPFPSLHVRHWIKQIEERGNAIIVGDVGTQKTSAAVVGLERLGCQRVLVVCRSYARKHWVDELKKYYRPEFLANMDPLVVTSAADLERLRSMKPSGFTKHRYIIIGYGALQHGVVGEEMDGSYGEEFTQALAALKPDALVIDEAHAINGTGCRSQRVLRLAKLESVRHRIMLTATPFENRPNEMANLATLLDPVTFPAPEVFFAMCRNNPRMYFGLMTQRMCDYFAQADVLDLPLTNLTVTDFFQPILFKCPPDMLRVHKAIQEDSEYDDRMAATRMVRFLSVPPAARSWYPALAGSRCFRDPLANPKLAYLKEQIADRIKTGKVVVASGIYAQGITRKLKDESEEMSTIVDLIESWFPGKVLCIDGTTPSGGSECRDEVQRRWKEDPEARILVASVAAASESCDFTLKRIPGSVERITIYYLTLPWKPTQYHQFNGRFGRPGSEVPLDVFCLLFEDTADMALLQLNERKWFNFLIGVYGMPLLPDEEDAIEHSVFRGLALTPSKWLRAAFERMMGLGEEGIEKFLKGQLRDLPVAETVAAYYLQLEDQGTPGHVSRIVTPTLKRWRERGVIPEWEEVLDVGPGPLILERKLGEPLHAIEINPMMLELGRQHSYHRGKNAMEGRASAMPAEWSGKFSMAIVSLVLDLTSHKAGKRGQPADRIRALQECHRVLKVDGLLWIIQQETCFDDKSLAAFLETVREYGFEPVEPWCNPIDAVGEGPRFTAWSILLRKRSELRAVDPTCPLFAYEMEREVDVKERRPKRPQHIPMPTPGDDQLSEQFVLRDLAAGQLPLEHATDLVEPPGIKTERLIAAMLKHFRIRNLGAATRLRQELDRARPRSLTELKEVWNRIRNLEGVPRIKWADLRSFAEPFLHAS